MNSDQTTNRIADLLKLSGISDGSTLEELTDHYLSQIEEEIRRGVNAQKALRETYQEIANLDTSQFIKDSKSKNKRGLFLFLLLFVGLTFYLTQQKNLPNQNKTKPNQIEDNAYILPPSGSPIQQSNLSISSEFGSRLNPFKNQRELHSGIDICAKIGTPVLSTGDGIVKETGYQSQAGKYITIQHEGNFLTKYFHLSDIAVVFNEKVIEGQMIGKVGNTGLSLMPHLHYEVLKDDVPVNPREYIIP